MTEVELRLLALFEAGRHAWPTLAVDRDAFVRSYAERWGEGDPPRDPAGADLYLAFACKSGAAGAVEAFERTLLGRVPKYLARFYPDAALLDDVCQIVREKLFVGANAKIQEFAGRGSLEGWLRVMTVRVFTDLTRQRGEIPTRERLEAAGSANDPEIDLVKARYRGHFEQAFRRAVASMSDEDRQLLRMHFMDGLTQDELATVMKVHRVTVARRIGAARRAILDDVTRILGDELGATSAELESLLHVVRSQLDVSLTLILAS